LVLSDRLVDKARLDPLDRLAKRARMEALVLPALPVPLDRPARPALQAHPVRLGSKGKKANRASTDLPALLDRSAVPAPQAPQAHKALPGLLALQDGLRTALTVNLVFLGVLESAGSQGRRGLMAGTGRTEKMAVPEREARMEP
jgi:hypothetical protein